MIPTHVLTNLKPDECVAVLSRGGELSFHIHPIDDEPESVRVAAARDGLGLQP